MQSSIINKETGSTKTVKGVNVKGRNILLSTSEGGVGKDESSEQIDISDLSAPESLENLKKLARSEASDIKWQVELNGNANKNTAVINHTNAIGLDAGSGILIVHAKDNVYVADASAQGSAINIDNIVTQNGNVRIYGKDGVYTANSVNNTNTAVIKTNDLIIEGGSSSVGTANKPVAVDVAGSITARSDKDVNIKQVNDKDMFISALYAGENVNLTSNKGITSVYNGVQADELGYLNAKGLITLNALNGNIGTSEEKAIRMLNNGGKFAVNANNNANVYVKGIGTKSLGVGDINVKDFIVNSEGELEFDGNVTAKGEFKLDVGSVSQSSGHIEITDSLDVLAQNGISLTSSDNTFAGIESVINSNIGDITLNGKTSEANSDTLKIKSVVNNAEDGEINISSVSVDADNLTAKGDVNVASTKGTNITNVTAGGSIKATSEKQVGIANAKAGKDISLANTKKDFSGVFGVTTSTLNAGGKVSLASEKGVEIGRSVNGTVIKAGSGIDINSKTDTRIHGTIEAENGNIDINGGGRVYAQLKNSSVISDNGDINVTAGKDISLSKTLAPNGNITLNAGTDVKTTFIQANKASVKLGDDADFGKIDPKTKLTMTRTRGANKGIFVAAVKPDGSYELVRPEVESMADFQAKNEVLQGKVVTAEKAEKSHDEYIENKDRVDIINEIQIDNKSEDKKEDENQNEKKDENKNSDKITLTQGEIVVGE